MERYPVPSLHRRGSTPSLVQFATINAQLKKERSSPSLEVIDNADTDEETVDSEDISRSSISKSVSQPALNILHITTIRGKAHPNFAATKRHFVTKNSFPGKSLPTGRGRSKKRDDFAASDTLGFSLKRSASHGVLANPPKPVAETPPPPQPSDDRLNNRRNTWCHASGTSAVAIDNKIEQAMDLVKSHLMFAVREEVEVLKEKIAELMERINQLEVENSILRAHASQETLAQLTAPPAAPALLPPAPPTGPVS